MTGKPCEPFLFIYFWLNACIYTIFSSDYILFYFLFFFVSRLQLEQVKHPSGPNFRQVAYTQLFCITLINSASSLRLFKSCNYLGEIDSSSFLWGTAQINFALDSFHFSQYSKYRYQSCTDPWQNGTWLINRVVIRQASICRRLRFHSYYFSRSNIINYSLRRNITIVSLRINLNQNIYQSRWRILLIQRQQFGNHFNNPHFVLHGTMFTLQTWWLYFWQCFLLFLSIY